jgi:metal-responsive CopG/Arc/MetJ family transcriptional regulator
MSTKSTPDPQIGIRLPEELKKEFFERAKKEDLTPSQIVRQLVKNWLKQPPTVGLGQ